MKIGAFAKHNQTSIDTIRHYMTLELLIPEKVGAQYLFDATCQSDFDEICQLKGIGFTLSEVQSLMLFRRIGKLTGYDKRITYKSYFENKRNAVEDELQRLNQIKRELEKTLVNAGAVEEESVRTLGVPMDCLQYAHCTKCHTPLQLLDGKIENGDLMTGTLTCSCGSSLNIIEGILYGEGLDKALIDIESESEHYIDQYIKTTDSAYLKKIYKELEWSKRHAACSGVENSVILELGTGHGFFMRHFIGDFHGSNLYIAVDHNAQVLLWLKKIIERSQPKCKVLFLCADFEKLPLKPASVDLLLDISGSSNYAFDHSDKFLLDKVDHLTKPETILHAYFILFEKFSKHTKIDDVSKKWFRLDTIKEALKRLKYIKTDDYISDSVEKGGPMEDYFVPGESVYTYLYF
ncbi:MAG TPA: MerR family transcriptional regulator, partial [Fusibacter sp.]|nr:MerR family transcriptional regulator [Fusibacter sp.]